MLVLKRIYVHQITFNGYAAIAGRVLLNFVLDSLLSASNWIALEVGRVGSDHWKNLKSGLKPDLIIRLLVNPFDC